MESASANSEVARQRRIGRTAGFRILLSQPTRGKLFPWRLSDSNPWLLLFARSPVAWCGNGQTELLVRVPQAPDGEAGTYATRVADLPTADLLTTL
jgi:hypothetical protein